MISLVWCRLQQTARHLLWRKNVQSERMRLLAVWQCCKVTGRKCMMMRRSILEGCLDKFASPDTCTSLQWYLSPCKSYERWLVNGFEPKSRFSRLALQHHESQTGRIIHRIGLVLVEEPWRTDYIYSTRWNLDILKAILSSISCFTLHMTKQYGTVCRLAYTDVNQTALDLFGRTTQQLTQSAFKASMLV